MKLQVAFDLLDIDEAVRIAQLVSPYADIIEIGSLLIYRYGNDAIRRFRDALPHAVLLADIKIVDRAKEAVSVCTQAGADWVSVLAGTERQVIRTASAVAHEQGKRVMLDLIDASSLGQSAMEAQDLGVDALLFHKPYDTRQAGNTLLESWDMVRGNTPLPVFISASVNRESVYDLLAVQPSALIIGKAIVAADNPAEEARYYHELLTRG